MSDKTKKGTLKLDKSLFHHDPTRTLEEVQKVNDVEQARNDVQEFHETPSVSRVLEALGELIPDASHRERFLYLHATFGSGKTHLLKLVGYATAQSDAPEAAEIASLLGDKFSGFKQLKTQLSNAKVDRFIPVFLNLLDRDASSEPPIPLLLYKALGRKLGKRFGYKTDPMWLLEFAFQLDRNFKLWSALWDYHLDSDDMYAGAFREAYAKRGMIRGWLTRAVAELANKSDDQNLRTKYGSEASVRRAINAAEKAVDAENFTATELAERIRWAKELLQKRDDESTDFIFGLDEVALFIGDERTRYTEFRRTIETLADEGVQPVIIGTGQWSLASIHKEFVGDPDPNAWYANEVELEGTDTEIIVRKRWLRKSPENWKAVKEALEASKNDILTSDERSDIGDRDSAAVESYPFRPTDLRHMREALQHLMSRGRTTRHEYVQGRALLVQVRALFTEHGWSGRELGALVPWSEIFELLDEETPFIPGWVRTLLERIEATVGDASDKAVDVARVIYLLNRIEDVDATLDNVVRLLVGSLDADVSGLRKEVEKALDILVNDKRYVRSEEGGKRTAQPVYRLLTEDEVTLAEKIEERAAGIQLSRLRNWIGEVVQNERLFGSEGLRREEKVGDERDVPLRTYYTILRELAEPAETHDAVAVRVVVTDDVDAVRKQWTKLHQDGTRAGEDLLVAASLPSGFEDRLRRQLATESVLDATTQGYGDLRDSSLEERRLLREELSHVLQDAAIYARAGKKMGKYADSFEKYIATQVVPEKFPHRKTLQMPLQASGDAPKLQAFFQSEQSSKKAQEWPLSKADAKMLGVDTFNREISGGWAAEFFEAFTHQVQGEDLIEAIQGRAGRWLGTGLEALQALLLTLACARQIQLRQGGKTILEPKRMAVAVRGKTNIESLTVKLEPPVDASELQRLQTVYRALTEEDSTPDEPEAIVHAIEQWARDHGHRIIEFRDRCLDSTFGDESEVDISALRKLIEPVFRAEPNARITRDDLTDDGVVRQAEIYRDVRPLLVGDETEQWQRFLDRAAELQKDHRTHDLTIQFMRLKSGQKAPSVSEVRSLLRQAKSIGTAVGEAPNGGDTAGDTSGTEAEKDAAEESESSPGSEPSEAELEEQSEDDVINDVVERLKDLPEGTVVVVENK
ncbi:hypothetical protein FIV42_15335 [Persicimonas caeni]|uniref:BREX system P-loop protein BrxC n=1 Tax=Persicimonas caeni TaxID=2292766 RepID=A0A4Y6PWE9_PERCE|nr:hypothetical protein [Persicimonas caeni]QDG52065.1 hypothetical protein FIV42_15335 [Persicimonas caeni]QED33286.1 hypothetical protein FRD00_15330 [Persicimonas caeni]